MKTSKPVLVSLFLIALSLTAQAQHKASCCAGPLMAAAGTDAFRAAHAEPEPFEYHGAGRWVELQIDGEKAGRAFHVPAHGASDRWVLVFHEWWGLNDHVRQQANRFHHDFNAHALVIDLYDGRLTTNADTAAKYMSTLDQQRVQKLLKSGIAYTGENAKIGTIGWCLGGVMSVHAAIAAGDKAVGCVTFYGLPEPESTDLAPLRCEVLGIFATKDDWITPDMVKRFEAKMKKAGKTMRSEHYDAVHAFANPSNPNFDRDATQRATAQAVAFLREKFSGN